MTQYGYYLEREERRKSLYATRKEIDTPRRITDQKEFYEAIGVSKSFISASEGVCKRYKIIITDPKTGEVYKSRNDAAKKIGITTASIDARIKTGALIAEKVPYSGRPLINKNTGISYKNINQAIFDTGLTDFQIRYNIKNGKGWEWI